MRLVVRISVSAAMGVALAGLAATVTVASSNPFKGVPFYHNSSVMTLDARGDVLQISYKTPRAGLKVPAGETLFSGRLVSGTWQKGKLSGTAFLFKEGCPAADYTVTGTVEDAGPNYLITLTGKAPVRRAGSCEVSGYSGTSPNATLVIESGVDQ